MRVRKKHWKKRPMQDLGEERIRLTEEENLLRSPEGLEEKRGESGTRVTSWWQEKGGRMCRGECPLDAPASRV